MTRAPPPFTAPDVTRASPTRERCTRSTRVAYVRRRGSAVSPSVDLGGSKTRTVLETVTVRFSRAAGGDSARAHSSLLGRGDAQLGLRPVRAGARTPGVEGSEKATRREVEDRAVRHVERVSPNPEPTDRPPNPRSGPGVTRKSPANHRSLGFQNGPSTPLTFDPRAHPTPTARTTPIGASA